MKFLKELDGVDILAIVMFGSIFIGALIVVLHFTILDGMNAEQRLFKSNCLESPQADKNRDTEFCKKGWPK